MNYLCGQIPENIDFIHQTKTMFNEIVNGNLSTISSSSPNGMFTSLTPSQDSHFGSMFIDNNQSTTDLQPNIGSGLTSFKEPLQDMFDLLER
ncbi:hypothetical protein Hanom_Chr16g01473061 [Helianthus anomalus]